MSVLLRRRWLYLVSESGRGARFLKIGITANLYFRLAGLKAGNPRPLQFRYAAAIDHPVLARELEAALLIDIGRHSGEWIDLRKIKGGWWAVVERLKAIAKERRIFVAEETTGPELPIGPRWKRSQSKKASGEAVVERMLRRKR